MQRHRIALPVLSLLIAQACSTADRTLGPADLAGTYSATQFTTTINGVTVDQLAEGVRFTITLAADGTTSGSLVVPAAGTDTVDLTGTWSRHGTAVTFDQSADTFIRQLPFQVDSAQLHGEGTFGPTTIRVTLSR